jgi:hypothetical protein
MFVPQVARKKRPTIWFVLDVLLIICTTQFIPLLAAYRLILIHPQEKNYKHSCIYAIHVEALKSVKLREQNISPLTVTILHFHPSQIRSFSCAIQDMEKQSTSVLEEKCETNYC